MNSDSQNTIEISGIDTYYERFRLPDKRRQQVLLSSIAENGVLEPLQGIAKDKLILLDGFKRLACAKKLNLHKVPFKVIATDETSGIVKFLKISNAKTLHIFEQAKLVKELRTVYQMSVREIATKLERSSGWVSTRLSFLKETTPFVQEEIFKGRFPASNAVYKLRQFKRLNKTSDSEINQFVESVAGKGISSRDIDLLADGYFKGGNSMKEQIQKGDISWAISKLKECESTSSGPLSANEERIVKDLEITQKYMGRLTYKLPMIKSDSKHFIATAGILVEGILSRIDKFALHLTGFLQEVCSDKGRYKDCGLDALSRRNGNQEDCTKLASEQKDSPTNNKTSRTSTSELS